ncbi:MAG: S8 family serine peptidase [Bacteroidetes bacterium]|jgi:subtilisin family serine protease|nr:S8 family serine peptidase [Bacteroidota bacterium]
MSSAFRLCLLSALLIAAVLPVRAQTPDASATVKYWIAFTDKPDAAKTDARAHLSERALERRQRRGTAPASRLDAPVSEGYLDRLERVGVTPLVTSRWLNAASAHLTETQARRIAALPFVRSVRPVGVVEDLPPPPPPDAAPPPTAPYATKTTRIDYGASRTQLELMNAIEPLERGINGADVTIGFLDTQYNDFSHPAFSTLRSEDRLIEVRNFTEGQSCGTSFHGMNVASTAVGFEEGELVGPGYGAHVLAATTECVGSETNQEEDNLVAGMEWLEAEGADVVNISLGYTTFDPGERSYTPDDLDGDTGVTTQIVDIAASLGVVVVSSAGNEGCSSPDFCWYFISTPADADSVITVGAVAANGTKAGFSSFGPTADGRIKPDVAAMGVSVRFASPGGGYIANSGTSFSSPLVAGVVAQILQVNPDLNPIDVRNILRWTASQAETPDNRLGWGIVNADAAIQAAEQTATATTPPETPSAFGVTAVYPNPVRQRATVEATLPASGSVRLTLYNLLGQRVATPFDGALPGGVHRLQIDLSGLPAGPYFYRLEQDDRVATGTVTRIR